MQPKKPLTGTKKWSYSYKDYMKAVVMFKDGKTTEQVSVELKIAKTTIESMRNIYKEYLKQK